MFLELIYTVSGTGDDEDLAQSILSSMSAHGLNEAMSAEEKFERLWGEYRVLKCYP